MRRDSDKYSAPVRVGQAHVPATLFGKLAETFESYVAPGQLVQVIGRLDAFEKQGKNGKAWLTLMQAICIERRR